MNFVEARNNMVLNQLRANRISNASLIEKIELFPRENLFPINFKHLSYSDSIIHLNVEVDNAGCGISKRECFGLLVLYGAVFKVNSFSGNALCNLR